MRNQTAVRLQSLVENTWQPLVHTYFCLMNFCSLYYIIHKGKHQNALHANPTPAHPTHPLSIVHNLQKPAFVLLNIFLKRIIIKKIKKCCFNRHQNSWKWQLLHYWSLWCCLKKLMTMNFNFKSVFRGCFTFYQFTVLLNYSKFK